MTGERVDPVVPLDPDRLDAIEAQPSLCNECRRPLNTTPGCIGHYPQPMRVLTEADALALVAAAREAIALRAEVQRLRSEVYAVREGAAEFRQAITEALPENPNDLLTAEQHTELNEALGRIAATRNPCWGPRLPTEGAPDE